MLCTAHHRFTPLSHITDYYHFFFRSLETDLTFSLQKYLILTNSLRVPSRCVVFYVQPGVRSETSGESTVRSNLVGNAGSRPISEAKQPWACPVLAWGTSGEAHVLYSFYLMTFSTFFSTLTRSILRSARLPSGTWSLGQLSLLPTYLSYLSTLVLSETHS